MEVIQVDMLVEYDTKRKVRFNAVSEGRPEYEVPPDVESIYLSKAGAMRLGQPTMVRVTVEALD